MEFYYASDDGWQVKGAYVTMSEQDNRNILGFSDFRDLGLIQTIKSF